MEANDHIIRAVAEQQAQQRAYGECGAQAMGIDPHYSPTLRDRLKRRIENFGSERAANEKANELFALLEKNPEVARILELVEELGGR